MFFLIRKPARMLAGLLIVISLLTQAGQTVFPINTTAQSDSLATGELLPAPVFSHQSGFYDHSFYLGISHADPEARIYFTLDGSVPNDSSAVFPDSMLIADRSRLPDQVSSIPTTHGDAEAWYRWYPPMDTVAKATNIRVRAMGPDGGSSATETRIYWVGEDLKDRYTLPVVSISMEQDDLFGDRGIYPNFISRGVEWERPAHIAFFEPDGTQGFATDAGLRIHGGNSRRYALKSFRVYFRGTYGESEIAYPLFPEQGTQVHERLVLRNGGSDWAFTYFRDPFVQSILSGFSDVDRQAYRPSVVFLNGEYWGVLNIRERYDDHYIEHHYGYTDIDMLENAGKVLYGSNEHYLALLSFLYANSLDVPENYEYVTTQMDVDNFRDYHILQVFSMNTDQPGKNVTYWRPQTPDGKWRWMWWDMDDSFLFGPHNPPERNGLVYSTGLDSISDPVVNDRTPPPSWAPNGSVQTFPLRALLSNKTFQVDFINRFADLLNTAFQPAFLSSMVDSFHLMTHDQMQEHFRRWHRPEPEVYQTHLQYLHDFSATRQQYMRAHLVTFFELDGSYLLHLDADAGKGHVRVNSIEIHEDTPSVFSPAYPWEGTYFKGLPLELEAIPAHGHVFSHWEVSTSALAEDTTTNRENDGYNGQDMKRANAGGLPDMLAMAGKSSATDTLDLADRVIQINPREDIFVKAHFFENHPPAIVADWTLLETHEGAEVPSYDMYGIFEDPDMDTLSFTASSSHPEFVHIQLQDGFLEVVPVRRGDATITLTASDGFYADVVFKIRVLVYPEAYDLQEGPFIFEYWDADAPERTYPEHMLFLQSDADDPGPYLDLHHPYHIEHDDYHANDEGSIGFPYNNTGRSRINGLGETGISFVNTGRGRDLGGALLAINTLGQDYVDVGWVGSTMLLNQRRYGIRLQYRSGTEGPFADMLFSGAEVNYVAVYDGHEQRFEAIPLPAELLDKPYVQLLWRYYHLEGDNGPRDMLGLGNIRLGVESPLQAASPGDTQTALNATIYPVPARDLLFVNMFKEDARPIDLFLYNQQGMLLWHMTIEGQGDVQRIVDTNDMNSGLYMLVFRSSDKVARKKVIISK